jgi:transcriptional regulator with XRE-family HTH domain
MSSLTDLSMSVRARRADMGLSQATLARLSGLSRATVNQVENGSLKDLSLSRAERLLDTLGLSLVVEPPRARRRDQATASEPLRIAARTASTSYSRMLDSAALRDSILTGTIPEGFEPHVRSQLDEAPMSLLAQLVEQLHFECHVVRPELWESMRRLAKMLKCTRPFWQ